MAYLKAGDTISGQEAVAKMTIKHPDGTTSIEDMFFGKDLEATCEIEKTDVRTLGKRGAQHKPRVGPSGSMMIYNNSFRGRWLCSTTRQVVLLLR